MSDHQQPDAAPSKPPPVIGKLEILEPESSNWFRALREIRHDSYHLPGYARLESESLGGVAVAVTYAEGARRCLLPLVLRKIDGSDRLDATSPYGYPGFASNIPRSDEVFWASACEALHKALSDLSAVSCFIRLNPLFEDPLKVMAEYGVVVQHGNTVAIDLTQSLESLWSNTRQNHRSQINRARRQGLSVVIDDWDREADFVNAYYETMRRVGATQSYFFGRAYFQHLHEWLGPNVHLAVVTLDGRSLGGGLFFECDGILQYHLGATLTEALKYQPTKLLFNEVSRWGKERGNRVLHLGGGVPTDGNLLFHFKAGFSDWHPPFHTWRIVKDRDAYAELCSFSDPEHVVSDLTSFFPAYRAHRKPEPAAAGHWSGSP